MLGCASLPAVGPGDSPAALARLVAERALRDFQQPPPFDWGEGVLMAGMMKAGVALHEPRYVEFVRSWADRWHRHGIGNLLEGDPTRRMQGYCGQWGPGHALMLLYEHTKEARYLDMAREIARFMLTEATRTKEGGLGHWRGNQQLWVDTLYMHGPLLAALYQLEKRPEYASDILLQLRVYTRHLQDPVTGLFYHMYDHAKGTHSPEFWARGNGWVAMTFAETLPVLGSTPETKGLRERFSHLMDGLRKTQDAGSGLWHTVLDRPESYLETSASAMFLASFVQGHRGGLLEGNDRPLIQRAWRGLTDRVDAWGWVFGTSGGTGPGPFENYARKTTGTYTWGTGAFLLAATALMTPGG